MSPEPWEYDITDACAKGVDYDDAVTVTVIRWAHHGDLRPFAWAIKQQRGELETILAFIAKLIDEGRLRVTKRRGSPRNLSAEVRNRQVAELYDQIRNKYGHGSDTAIEGLAQYFRIGEKSVRAAITARRKRAK
jgi:hypothetical protein